MNDEQRSKKSVIATWSLAASLLVLIFVVYVLLFLSKGWMSYKRDVTGRGNGVNVTGTSNLLVRKESGGADIDDIRAANPDDPTADDLPLVFDGARIRPGSQGSFTAYIVNDPSSVQPSYSLILNLYAEGIIDTTQSPYNEMSQAELDTVLEQALTFVNTHIAFFTSYNPATKLYSGYIPAKTDFSHPTVYTETAQTPDAEQTLTIYWVWVEYLSDINAPESDRDYTISAADRQAMQAQIAANRINWFYGATGTDSTRYNNADMYLAGALAYINFEMEITENR